jgi:hypothetical protein
MKNKSQQVAFLQDWDTPQLERAKYVVRGVMRVPQMVKRVAARVRQLTAKDFSKKGVW